MTWHKDPWRMLRAASASLVWVAMGCGDGDDRSLHVVDPEADAELTMADDVDPDQPGLQYDVVVHSTDMLRETPVLLFVGGEQAAAGEIGGDGEVKFSAVTLQPGRQTIYVSTTTGSLSSDKEQQYLFRSLAIASPKAGVVDGDADPAAAGIQVEVVVDAFGVEGDITLQVDGDEAGEEAVVDDKATFEITLEPGEHSLVAKGEDELESEPVVIEVVAGGCGMVTLVNPKADGDSNKVTLGGSDNSCPDSGTYTTTVEVSTGVPAGTDARLFVNNPTTWVPGVVADDGSLTFEDVPLELRESANSLYVVLETDTPCRTDFDLEIFVDCDGPDCSITAPEPFEGVGEDGEATDYINADLGADGFDVTVRTTSDVDNRKVTLLVDGEPLSDAPTDDGDNAIFNVSGLEDGEHTFQAQCEDASGNLNETTERNWVLDTSPCEVAITSPADGSALDESNDENGDIDDGYMVVVEATVSGNGCVDARATLCDPAEGISDDVQFGAYSGGPLTVTVVDMMDPQNICVEIRDRAGNTSRATVGISTPGAPSLLPIVSADPTSSSYRSEPLQLTWTLPGDLDPAFTTYDFRCHVRPLELTDLSDTEAEEAQTKWWGEARAHLRTDGTSLFTPDGSAPDVRTGSYAMPTGGQQVYCALRVCNGATECTPLPTRATRLEKPFRQQLISSGVDGLLRLGERVEPAGDVNGDGNADVLVTAAGASTSAMRTGVILYLGGDTPASPSIVEITQAVTDSENFAGLGRRAVGLGDVNGDGLDDFAISFPGDNAFSGVVYVFFGRLQGDAWPTTVDLDGDCGADLCIRPDSGALFFGGALVGVGDFDGTAPNDIAIGAQGNAGNAGSLYVLLGEADDIKCSVAACPERGGDAFFGVDRTVTATDSADFRGFILTHPVASEGFGAYMAAAGRSEVAPDATDDLMVLRSAGGSGELYRLTGRPYTGGAAGLVAIPPTDAKSVMTGAFDQTTTLGLLGDVWAPADAPATMTGMSDFGIHFVNTSYLLVLPGDSALEAGFSADVASSVQVHGPAGSSLGESICGGEVPALGWLDATGTDLDGDGTQDMCLGGAPVPGAAAESYVRGEVFYFVGDVLALKAQTPSLYDDVTSPTGKVTVIVARPEDENTRQAATLVTPDGAASDPATATGTRSAQLVGDVTGDGVADIVVGDPPQRDAQRREDPANPDNQGGFWLLY